MRLIGRLLVLLLAGALAACAAREGVPRPFPGARLPPGADSAPPATPGEPIRPPERAEAGGPPAEAGRPSDGSGAHGFGGVVAMALGYRGVPYRWGGSDPAGFDCSGFVQYVFKQVGALLPREVRDQFAFGEPIDRDEVAPGDLVFFQTVARGASHVGLAIGGGEFVHAPSTNGVVRVERLTSSYWSKRFVGARRVGAADRNALKTD